MHIWNFYEISTLINFVIIIIIITDYYYWLLLQI